MKGKNMMSRLKKIYLCVFLLMSVLRRGSAFAPLCIAVEDIEGQCNPKYQKYERQHR